MRPLPPYTVRPLKRREEPKAVLPSAVLRETAQGITDEMSVKAGRLAIKGPPLREKPRLKVLERPAD